MRGVVGSLSDTTFTHAGVGYEVERLLWWPNGTVRLDVYPDGLETAIGADAVLVITPVGVSSTEYVWHVSDSRIWVAAPISSGTALSHRMWAPLTSGTADRGTGCARECETVGLVDPLDARTAGPTWSLTVSGLSRLGPTEPKRRTTTYRPPQPQAEWIFTYLASGFSSEFTIQVRALTTRVLTLDSTPHVHNPNIDPLRARPSVAGLGMSPDGGKGPMAKLGGSRLL